MRWDLFNTRETDERRAFEAFSGQLFEHYCRRTFGASLLDVRFVNGDGGDGGVEAYALVRSTAADQPDVIGLQAKWFRDPIEDQQIRQIKKSFDTAITIRPRLVRYCIAIPRNLGDDRVSTKFSERQRFEKWKNDAIVAAPNTTIELWDEARIQSELTHSDNKGVDAYWFSQSVLRPQFLRDRFGNDEKGWLSKRYLPSLHAPGDLEADLDFRLGGSNARKNLLDKLDTCLATIRVTRDDVARLPRYRDFMALTDAQVLLTSANELFERLIRTAERLQIAFRTGSRINEPFPIKSEERRILYELDRVLEEIETRSKSSGWAATHDIAARVAYCIRENVEGRGLNEGSALSLLYDLWESFQQRPALIAYVGAPGIGKTHGLANAVKTRLADELPALLLRAKDCPIEKGWSVVLAEAIDWPNVGLETMLNALEATCIRADVKRAENSVKTGELEFEPTWFLLAIDGLEESGQHARWAERLGELTQILQGHSRIRVAVTLRTRSRDAILSGLPRDRYEELDLRPDKEEVQALLLKYCTHDGVELPHRRLRWALRDPLSVRLYCDIRSKMPQWTHNRANVSLPALLSKKLDLAESNTRHRVGLVEGQEPLRRFLRPLAQACVERGRLLRDEALAIARKAEPSVDSLERWMQIFEAAEQEGLLLATSIQSDDELAPRVTTVQPAYDPLTDYFVAEAAVIEIVQAVEERKKSDSSKPISIPQILRRRLDACEQVALLLAEKHGISLIQSGIFQDVFQSDDIEALELRTIAALDANRATNYRAWVIERLTASMPSCRRVLKELCIPVSRDSEHPFGPRFVHEILLQYETPAKRDLIWSGPAILPGNGDGPWEGYGEEALETLVLDDEDPADGPPLLLAWALTSVDHVWRRKVRAKLALWGSKRLDVLPSWLDLVTQSNDPQMLEDVAMITFGAACLAGTDERLANLVLWADTFWLMPESPKRQENIVVLHAARGIVERARVMGIDVADATLERARKLYVVDDRLLPIDEKAAREADDHDGIQPITGDLAWYVVPRAIESFFYGVFDGARFRQDKLDPQARQMLLRHANSVGLDDMTPQCFAFGALTALLRNSGWNERESDRMDLAVHRRYHKASHGSRSAIGGLVEKYIWAGCNVLMAYLAARLPARDRVTQKILMKVPVDPTRIADLEPNPASETFQSISETPWEFFADEGLIGQLPASAYPSDATQLERAVIWVENAPLPDVQPWLIPPESSVPIWAKGDEWITLYADVRIREADSQAEVSLDFNAVMADPWCLSVLRANVALGHGLQDCIYEFRESIACRFYTDPLEAIWAPWARGINSTLTGRAPTGDVRLLATVAHGTYKRTSIHDHRNWLDGEGRIVMPSFHLRRAIGLVDAVPLHAGTEWWYRDRAGVVQAVYTRRSDGQRMHCDALLVRRNAVEMALQDSKNVLLWSGVTHRQPYPALLDERPDWTKMERKWRWLGFLTNGHTDIVTPSDGADDTNAPTDAPPTAPIQPIPPPPVIPVGPQNPTFAVPLTSDLDNDDAIPYFLWDDPIPVREVRHRLANGPERERDSLLGKILREARDTDVWRFTTPNEVARRFGKLKRHLGRRRPFWEFLLQCWFEEGLLAEKPA